MSVRSFFDTNVLVYADDSAAPAKQQRAIELVSQHRRARTGVVSLQVLQEYFVTVTRKLHLDARIARRKVELLAEFDVAAPEVGDILAAIDLHRLHTINFWNALVVRAAKQTGCSVLLSEDMQGHREIEGVQIVNPFLQKRTKCRLAHLSRLSKGGNHSRSKRNSIPVRESASPTASIIEKFGARSLKPEA